MKYGAFQLINKELLYVHYYEMQHLFIIMKYLFRIVIDCYLFNLPYFKYSTVVQLNMVVLRMAFYYIC